MGRGSFRCAEICKFFFNWGCLSCLRYQGCLPFKKKLRSSFIFHLVGLKQCCIPKTSSLGCIEQNWGHLQFGKKWGRLPFSKILRLSSINHLVKVAHRKSYSWVAWKYLKSLCGGVVVVVGSTQLCGLTARSTHPPPTHPPPQTIFCCCLPSLAGTCVYNYTVADQFSHSALRSTRQMFRTIWPA